MARLRVVPLELGDGGNAIASNNGSIAALMSSHPAASNSARRLM
jgi:hypothetical protein